MKFYRYLPVVSLSGIFVDIIFIRHILNLVIIIIKYKSFPCECNLFQGLSRTFKARANPEEVPEEVKGLFLHWENEI